MQLVYLILERSPVLLTFVVVELDVCETGYSSSPGSAF